MARIKIYSPHFNVFGAPFNTAEGWIDEFEIMIHGDDVPGGQAKDVILVELRDQDSAAVMDGKQKSAAIAKAAERGFSVPQGSVISYAQPRKL